MSGKRGKQTAASATAPTPPANKTRQTTSTAAAAAGSSAASAHTPMTATNTASTSVDMDVSSSPPATVASSSAVTPISSPHDPHVYRHVTLSNGLSSLLIVDKPRSASERAREEARKKKTAKKVGDDAEDAADDDESKPAVVALSVRVGHWSDPAAVPGLAHFCEHMLFMGNKANPSENEWYDGSDVTEEMCAMLASCDPT